VNARAVAGTGACALAALAALACSRPDGAAADAGARASFDAGVATTADAAPRSSGATGPQLVTQACLACHSEEILAQQRLPRDRWGAEVKKMVGWGAAVSPGDVDVLADHLAALYGPDAGAWEPRMIAGGRARAALEPEDDGPLAHGDAAHGNVLFAERCASCHGTEARGLPALGVNLVERPVLGRAAVVLATVRGGRGLMPPMPTTTEEDARDLVAHLRTLRVP
jgi:cytochrome c oxidase cbb3-type subunit 3